MKDAIADSARAAELRARLADELVAGGTIVSMQVEAAFRTVPRHLFAPGATLEQSYAQDTVRIKRDEQGTTLSAVSAPQIQAMMLDQAQLEAGMRVLEIGSGGYNAALIAELVGETGQVTTVDIDPDVVDRARNCLTAAGYPQVDVVLADAEDGVPDRAPYDRIIVTVGAWDIPPAWSDQLVGDGRIVVPLRMRGLTRSVTLERDGHHLVSRDYRLCGFVPMQGIGAYSERVVALDGDRVGLRVDGEQPVDVDRLRDALLGPRVERWSGLEFGAGEGEPLHDLDLWVATMVNDFGLLTATKEAIDSGLVSKSTLFGGKTMMAGGSFAYRAAARPVDAERTRFEFGAYGHGPDAARLAEDYVDLIQAWERDHCGGPGAQIEVYPAATPEAELPPGRVINKRHTRVVISWPGPR
ncbi:MAG TPA: methyltransferase, FxLD system [Pseudonocardiaceae bacterium]|nr:methyltransferase, FxLD system [Pseudonocardiaceae bacterium]